MAQENLNKENFWNEMQQRCPLAMKEFCVWIDIYKEKNKWEDLFNDSYSKTNYQYASNGEVTSIDFAFPKFHDLPLAMQMGIWNHYVESLDIDSCKKSIEYDLFIRENELSCSKTKKMENQKEDTEIAFEEPSVSGIPTQLNSHQEEFIEDEEEGSVTIYGDPKCFGQIQKHLEENGFEVIGAEFTYIPNDLKDVTPEERESIDKMVERLEEFDDVQTVYTNMKPAED